MRNTAQLRNIAVVGHGGTGKTTLVEHILQKTGAIKKCGTIEEGNTFSDTLPDEKERKISIETSVAVTKHQDVELQILDAPGYPDFVGQAISALHAVETALITIDAVDGIAVNTRRMWSEAGKLGIARVLVVTKMDAENADYDKIMESIRNAFGKRCVPFVLPDGQGPNFGGIISLLTPPDEVPAGAVASIDEMHEMLVERIVEVDDDAVEKYLEGVKPELDDLAELAKRAIAAGTMVPILFVSSEKDAGVQKLLDFVAGDLPSPVEGLKRVFKESEDADGEAVEPDPAAPLRAQVFRVVSDPFVGKITMFRIFSGTLNVDDMVTTPAGGKSEKLHHIYRPMGKEQVEIKQAIPGDIVQIAKIESFHFGDTITAAGVEGSFERIRLPMPMVSVAVEPKKRGDEAKIGGALSKIDESDPSLVVKRDEQTAELVVSGMSTLHLDIVFDRLKNAGVEVDTKPPRIPYLETIAANGDAKYRHKKQTGGAGQFAEVWMRISPRQRGEGFEFKNSIVGGAISGPFVGSVEKGVRQVLESGVVAGYPVVDVLVEIYDGKEHPVDSKDIAFQIAGRNAFKEAFQAAKPCLLEPVVMMEVMVPAQYMGDVTGDISSRRGRVQGTDSEGDMQIIKALVPLSEVASYSTELRAMTGGEGSFTMEIADYDAVPARTMQEIVAASKKDEEEKD